MCTTMGFIASLDSDRIFLIDFLLKVVKTQVSRLVDSSKYFSSCCENNKCEQGFVMFTGLRREGVASFWGGTVGCR